jgi:hypothetical protein
MVLTTKEARYIIVFGIVISILPISSTNELANMLSWEGWDAQGPMEWH